MAHETESKLTFWIDNSQLVEFDKAIKEKGYRSRAEWLREKVREELNK